MTWSGYAAAAALFLSWTPGADQAPRTATLGQPSAAYAQAFGLVNTVRELGDGRVVVADPLGGEVVILDAALRQARPVGREGAGPGEYRQPDAVYPLPGDSTLVVDLGNARLSVLAPNGTFARSFPMVLGQLNLAEGPPTAMLPGGTDARGRIYFQGPGFGRDSTELLRFDPATRKVDTLVRLKLPDVERQESGGENQRRVSIRTIPFAASDGWAVGANGAVAALRVRDYHLDWIDAGRVRSGPPAGAPPVRIGRAEKEEWVERTQLTGGIGMQVQNVNGEVSVSFGRNRAQGRIDVTGYKWPERKPAFDPGAIRVDPQGRVWVFRHLAAGQAALYDVFGPDGALAGSVRFPAGRRLVGFGARGLYAVALSEDGESRLERYAQPL